MGRQSDSYSSLIRGVSQQTAHDRLSGQHWAQDNMISDPVRGLSRRHGSVYLDEMDVGTALSAQVRDDLAARKEHTFYINGVEYALFYRDGSVLGSGGPQLVVVNKDTGKLVPTNLTIKAERESRNGISAITVAGEYVLLASANRPTEYFVSDNLAATRKQHAIWVRGGAYSRTFTVTVTDTSDGSQQQFSYTTMKSYYDVPLDTSDIPWNKPDTQDPDPAYNKKINDRTNAYNSAVNKHIADAAKDITPENIASKLALQMRTVYPGAFSNGAYVLLQQEGIVISADDGGNNDFLRVASRDVESPEQLTEKHFPGKVMIVQPKTAGSLPYYMRAESATGANVFTEVIWRETAGQVVTPTFMFLVGKIVGGTLYVGETPGELAELLGTEVPGFEKSRCGDLTARPLPDMFGRAITYLHMFQDRLMIVCGATHFFSKTGDYFNFFTDSMLTIKDDDPVEVFAQGTEDDTITAGVQLDRNLILFGKRFQYIVPGRETLTPRSAYVGVAATYEGSNIAHPVSGGALTFFCQRRESRLTMQQLQPGSVADRMDAFDVSTQLDGYLTGTPVHMVAMTSPSVVFIKTKELTNGFYVYSFLDSSDQTERLFDSWSRWMFSGQLGTLVGITADNSGLLAVTARETPAGPRLVLDRFSRETDTSDLPYLDSLQRGYSGNIRPWDAYVAYDRTSVRWLMGEPLANAAALDAKFPTETGALWSGYPYSSYVDLTSPYIRDRQDRAILDAKLTVTKLAVSVTNTAALTAEISTDAGKTYRTALDWTSRPVGGWVLNTQSVDEQKTLTVPVQKDNKTYRARLRSASWLPLTLSVVEWTGQVFTSRR